MDLSILIHTCDSYSRFWAGMLYSLDFYWDYEKIPVYWASEEQTVFDIDIKCKDLTYKPNNLIRPILTGKTDRNGFSDRMIHALEQIPSKWVLYIQEDMWLKSRIDYNTFLKLILFAEQNKADSIKLHSKLFYYDNYRLESTDSFVDNIRMLKFSEGENYLLSHNATIWNREYLLMNQAKGEDPWTNEVNGSNRMSIGQSNHFHYNIHWYCQPGVCDMGEFSEEFKIYAPLIDEMMNMKMKFNL